MKNQDIKRQFFQNLDFLYLTGHLKMMLPQKCQILDPLPHVTISHTCHLSPPCVTRQIVTNFILDQRP